MEQDKQRQKTIEELIHSDSSPVGIDAKKTHVLIIEMLMRIEERLEQLERRLARRPVDD